MQINPIISDVRVIPANYNSELLVSEEAKKILDKIQLRPISCEFKISGTYPEIANSIRQSLMTLPCKKLYVKRGTCDTSDPDIWESYIIKRLSLLPINQDIPDDAKFALDVYNSTDEILYVYSSDITSKGKPGRQYFDGIYEICSLSPGFYIRIPEILVLNGYNTAEETKHYNLVYDAASVPLDIEPFDEYTGAGVSTLVAAPKEFLVRFSVNGEADPILLARKACTELARRVNQFGANAIVESQENYHEFYMKENIVLGGPLQVAIYELFTDDIGCVNYVIRNEEILVIRLLSKKDPKQILEGAVNYLNGLYSGFADSLT